MYSNEYHNISSRLNGEDWNKLQELLDYYTSLSKGKVSISDVIKVSIRTTHKKMRLDQLMQIDSFELGNENKKLHDQLIEIERGIDVQQVKLNASINALSKYKY